MTTNKKSFENKYVLGCLVILAGCSLLFQNCSPLKSQKTEPTTTTPIEIQDQSVNSAKLTWGKGSGAVSPDYQYSYVYEVVFATKSFKVTVNKGALVTDAPSAQNKTISDAQITQIKSLMSKVKGSSCKSGDMLIGGGSDSLGFYSNAAKTSPETVIYGTDCTGLSSSFFQATSGFADLTTYLKSL